MYTRIVRLVALSLVCATLSAEAQDPVAAPRAVVDSFVRHLAAGRFRDAARLMDLEALDAHRKQMTGDGAPWLRPSPVTAEFFLEHDPAMPRVVAEYQAKRINDEMRKPRHLADPEFGFGSSDSLATASAEELGARWLRRRDLRTMLRESLEEQRRNGCLITGADIDSLMRDQPAVSPPRVIGVVRDDSVAYAVYEWSELRPTPAERAAMAKTAGARDWLVMPPSILLLRQIAGRWLIVPTVNSSLIAMDVGSTCQNVEPKVKRRR